MEEHTFNKNSMNNEAKSALLAELENSILELNIALENYNSATPELVDYYSYQIKAAEARYDYLLKLIKDMNISKFKKIV